MRRALLKEEDKDKKIVDVMSNGGDDYDLMDSVLEWANQVVGLRQPNFLSHFCP